MSTKYREQTYVWYMIQPNNPSNISNIWSVTSIQAGSTDPVAKPAAPGVPPAQTNQFQVVNQQFGSVAQSRPDDIRPQQNLENPASSTPLINPGFPKLNIDESPRMPGRIRVQVRHPRINRQSH